MLATISNLKGVVTAIKKAAATRSIDEATLYNRAGVTGAQVDALVAQLGAVDHATLIRIANVARVFVAVQQFNGFDDVGSGGAGSNDLSVTHNGSVSSVFGDLKA